MTADMCPVTPHLLGATQHAGLKLKTIAKKATFLKFTAGMLTSKLSVRNAGRYQRVEYKQTWLKEHCSVQSGLRSGHRWQTHIKWRTSRRSRAQIAFHLALLPLRIAQPGSPYSVHEADQKTKSFNLSTLYSVDLLR